MLVAMLLGLAASLYAGRSGRASHTARAPQTAPSIPSGKPEATIDLATDEGANLVKGEWRYSDTKIIEVNFKGPGPDKQPTGHPIKTYDYEPKAGPADFDDSKWEIINPTSLSDRRSTGRLCFNWYRKRQALLRHDRRAGRRRD